jgi:hypothetical protein
LELGWGGSRLKFRILRGIEWGRDEGPRRVKWTRARCASILTVVLLLEFRGSKITSDAGLLAYRKLDDTLRLTDTGAEMLADARTGKNGRHLLAGLLRQSVFGRLAGYEDVNDAVERREQNGHRPTFV